MGKRWRISPHDAAAVADLERRSGVPPVVAQLLVSRGVTDPGHVQSFLDVKLSGLRDPELLPGLTEAADRIHAALRENRRIVIYGDYDADGMTGTGLLFNCLRLLGGDIGYYVPNRLDEGYGLNDQALEKLAADGTQLIVSVDCGVASISPAETARRLGLELIITDHHQLAEQLPQADAIVHPALPGSAYPFNGLCGAGVAFKLAWGLCQRASQAKRVQPAMREFLLGAVGLAAMGTIADVVPLLDENRILVRHGLVSLRERPVLGIAALMKLTNLDQKPELSAEDVAFMLAPRLNAAGRLGQALLGVELLTTTSQERATALADYIHKLNKDRDSLERSVYAQANKQAKEQFDPGNDPALVLAGVGWHAGVIGIVAGRLAEKYNCPVIIISLDQVGAKPGIGSARSAAGVNLHEALTACSDNLISCGGHAQAAGLKIVETKLDRFRGEFCDYVAGELGNGRQDAEIRIDAEAPFSQLTLNTLQQIEQLSPFGEGNPRPVLCTTGVTLAEPPRKIGGGERHLSLKLRQHGVARRAVGFGRGEEAEELAEVDGPLDIAYRAVINHYRGRRSVDLHLVDWRVAGSTAAID